MTIILQVIGQIANVATVVNVIRSVYHKVCDVLISLVHAIQHKKTEADDDYIALCRIRQVRAYMTQ